MQYNTKMFCMPICNKRTLVKRGKGTLIFVKSELTKGADKNILNIF